MIPFEKDTIYDTIGVIINSSKKCKQSISPRGMHYRFLCKIYDRHAKMIAECTTTQKGAFKVITREMHAIGEGSIECICHPHPR